MTDFTQTIKEIEEEIRKTPYHKGTEHHIGKLRARLARMKDSIFDEETRRRRGSGGSSGYALRKYGDATVVLVGPPSVGKSTLINKLTNAESKVAAYEFTTVSVIPGMLKYNDAYIQIFDLPGIIEGAGQGRGRGREVLSVTRNSDLILIMCDVKTVNRLPLIMNELESAGIRLNQKKPAVKIQKNPAGGIIIHSNIKRNLDTETVKNIACEMGIKNAEITLSQKVSVDDLIDVFSPNRAYIPAVFVVNKIDLDPQPLTINHLAISAVKETGLEELKEKIWEKLQLVKIFLIRPDEEPGQKNPMIMRMGDTLADLALKIGEEFAEDKIAAKIWGAGSIFPGQEVSLSTHVLEDMQVRFI